MSIIQKPLQLKASEESKTMRKRRILMKEKCNFINHEISFNLQKLDTLLSLIKTKKQEINILSNIPEQLNEEENDQQTVKQVRKQRRLKFKYSIYRQYEFQQNAQQINSPLNNHQQTHQQPTQTDQDQMLLDGFTLTGNFLTEMPPNHPNDDLQQPHQQPALNHKQSTPPKLKRFTSLRDSQYHSEQPNTLESITIQTRYNWIERYLNHEFNDTVVKGVSGTGDQLEVVRFRQKDDRFQCRLGGQEEGSFSMKDLTNCGNVGLSQKLGMGEIRQKDCTQCQDYEYKEFLHENPFVKVEFPKHTCQIQLIDPQKQEVVRLALLEKGTSVRVLIKSQNHNPSQMQRIMIFKEICAQQNSPNEKYKIVWSKYDKQSFLQDIILEGGQNYLITNLCCNPSSSISLLMNPLDLPSTKLHKAPYDPWRSYNILCSSFQQCNKVFMSSNIFDDQKPLEFLRANYLDYGLILQIYQNIHPQKISFIDEKEHTPVEDIALLFEELYTEGHNSNTYEEGELVIKFFEVTEKPARLYYPEKRILVGSQVSEQVVVYSTFK